jgi:hypothetical protein
LEQVLLSLRFQNKQRMTKFSQFGVRITELQITLVLGCLVALVEQLSMEYQTLLEQLGARLRHLLGGLVIESVFLGLMLLQTNPLTNGQS